uniref:folate gamma-glutamyl hydrolase n=1 Tax=Hucho hucho TaxID=62062 RepID=A0A4W5M3J5_9TELE
RKSNDEPIIGELLHHMTKKLQCVLAQEVYSPRPQNASSIAASNVKFLESAGARVVHVMINRTLEEYKTLFNSINGIIYPGGGVSILTSGYANAARIFYELAIEANSRGDLTCLGFEELKYLTSGKMLLSHTNTSGVALPLVFTNIIESRMFKGFYVSSVALIVNYSCNIVIQIYNSNADLRKFYKSVSTMEACGFPIYGTQWHPEKNTFEWTKPYIPHSPLAVKVTFFMADFFVNEARKNFHKFEDEEVEKRALIYNYNPVYTGIKSVFEQIYYF